MPDTPQDTTPVQPFTYDPSIASNAWSAFETARKYREDAVDKAWTNCFEYDEAYNAKMVNIEAGDKVKRTIALPIIRNNNRRKAASIGAVEIKPTVYTETLETEGFADVREKVLRWAVRNSGLKEAVDVCDADLVSIGHGVLQLTWDPDALDGQGAPYWESKDPRNVYLDPRRRHRDIDRDCRWVFEVQQYSLAELNELWPEYFKDLDTSASQTAANRVTLATLLNTVSPEEGGLYTIILVEYSVKKNGIKRVMTGILDPGRKEWIEPPIDNGLGCFSYVIHGLPPSRGRAYPVPPNLAEHELVNLTNLAYTLFVRTGLKNADPPVFFDRSDQWLMAKFVKQKDTVGPGEWIPHETGQQPKPMEVTSPDIFLEVARALHAQANDSADVQTVQRGEAPRGVSSGKAINALQAFADAGMEEYRQAKMVTYTSACTKTDRMMQSKITAYREMMYQEGNQMGMIPMNAQQGTTEYDRIAQLQDQGGMPVYRSARMYKREAPAEGETEPREVYVGSASIENAQALQDRQEIDFFEEWLNDMKLGKLEVTIQVEPRRDRAQRQQLAMLLLQIMGKGVLRYSLTEIGVENVNDVIDEVQANDQVYQAGETLLSNPELMQAVQTLSQDPILMKLITDPAASGRLKLALARTRQPVKPGTTNQ